MNDKTTLQELVDALVQRHQMEPTDAEAFVREVLHLIEEALASDKYVKIKGLGTFKLIEVEERESVDVNSGERIRIQSHSRISFVPDPFLRDLVNKPFAHFETVVLNEGTHFNDLEENFTDEKEEEQNEEDSFETFGSDTPAEEVKEESAPVRGVCEEAKTDAGLPQKQADTALETTALTKEEKTYRLPWCMIASVLLAGVILGGGIIWGLLSGRRYIPETVVSSLVENKKVASPVISDRDAMRTKPDVEIKRDTIPPLPDKAKSPKPSVYPPAEKKTSSREKPENLSDTVDYTITGTKFVYTVGEGETLVRIALKFYGSKKLWPYLVKHNEAIIKDANNVPAGLIIRIPALSPKQ